jgi:excisionase family DNA binding protein
MDKPKLPVTYSPSEVAEHFGVTRRTVYEWLLSGALTADKAGPRKWRISRDDLDLFIAASSARKEKPVASPKADIMPTPTQHTLPPEMLPTGSGRVMVPEPATARPKPQKLAKRRR